LLVRTIRLAPDLRRLYPACSDASFRPKLQRGVERIDACVLPPNHFVSKAVNITMVAAAQWNRVLIAHLAAERAELRKAEVMGVRGFPTADQTRLGSYECQVGFVTPTGPDVGDACIGAGRISLICTATFSRCSIHERMRIALRQRKLLMTFELTQAPCECPFQHFGIFRA
jgi:hypothetical protein